MKLNVNSPPYVLVFAAVVSALFTAAIMSLDAATGPIVRRNEKLFERKALVDVFGLGRPGDLSDDQITSLYERHVRPVEGTLRDPESGAEFERLYKAVKTNAETGQVEVVGYAFPIRGTGFWARIDGYLAVTEDLNTIVGIVFIRHAETPGLGGRITEAKWRAKFKGLTVAPPGDGKTYVYIGGDRPSGPADPRHGRHVDAITGATGTSSAVSVFLNRRIAQFRRAADAAKLIPPTRAP